MATNGSSTTTSGPTGTPAGTSTMGSAGAMAGAAGAGGGPLPGAGTPGVGEPWPQPGGPERDPRAAYDERPQGEFSAFLDDLSELLRGTPVGDIRAQLHDRVEQARRSLEHAMGQAQQASAEIGQRAREEMDRRLESTRQTVHEHPLTAVGVSAAIGFLVGVLFGRQR